MLRSRGYNMIRHALAAVSTKGVASTKSSSNQQQSSDAAGAESDGDGSADESSGPLIACATCSHQYHSQQHSVCTVCGTSNPMNREPTIHKKKPSPAEIVILDSDEEMKGEEEEEEDAEQEEKKQRQPPAKRQQKQQQPNGKRKREPATEDEAKEETKEEAMEDDASDNDDSDGDEVMIIEEKAKSSESKSSNSRRQSSTTSGPPTKKRVQPKLHTHMYPPNSFHMPNIIDAPKRMKGVSDYQVIAKLRCADNTLKRERPRIAPQRLNIRVLGGQPTKRMKSADGTPITPSMSDSDISTDCEEEKTPARPSSSTTSSTHHVRRASCNSSLRSSSASSSSSSLKKTKLSKREKIAQVQKNKGGRRTHKSWLIAHGLMDPVTFLPITPPPNLDEKNVAMPNYSDPNYKPIKNFAALAPRITKTQRSAASTQKVHWRVRRRLLAEQQQANEKTPKVHWRVKRRLEAEQQSNQEEKSKEDKPKGPGRWPKKPDSTESAAASSSSSSSGSSLVPLKPRGPGRWPKQSPAAIGAIPSATAWAKLHWRVKRRLMAEQADGVKTIIETSFESTVAESPEPSLPRIIKRRPRHFSLHKDAQKRVALARHRMAGGVGLAENGRSTRLAAAASMVVEADLLGVPEDALANIQQRASPLALLSEQRQANTPPRGSSGGTHLNPSPSGSSPTVQELVDINMRDNSTDSPNTNSTTDATPPPKPSTGRAESEPNMLSLQRQLSSPTPSNQLRSQSASGGLSSGFVVDPTLCDSALKRLALSNTNKPTYLTCEWVFKRCQKYLGLKTPEAQQEHDKLLATKSSKDFKAKADHLCTLANGGLFVAVSNTSDHHLHWIDEQAKFEATVRENAAKQGSAHKWIELKDDEDRQQEVEDGVRKLIPMLGLFAGKDIPEGSWLTEYGGVLEWGGAGEGSVKNRPRACNTHVRRLAGTDSVWNGRPWSLLFPRIPSFLEREMKKPLDLRVQLQPRVTQRTIINLLLLLHHEDANHTGKQPIDGSHVPPRNNQLPFIHTDTNRVCQGTCRICRCELHTIISSLGGRDVVGYVSEDDILATFLPQCACCGVACGLLPCEINSIFSKWTSTDQFKLLDLCNTIETEWITRGGLGYMINTDCRAKQNVIVVPKSPYIPSISSVHPSVLIHITSRAIKAGEEIIVAYNNNESRRLN